MKCKPSHFKGELCCQHATARHYIRYCKGIMQHLVDVFQCLGGKLVKKKKMKVNLSHGRTV